jgi:diaminopimelate decarboxylase
VARVLLRDRGAQPRSRFGMTRTERDDALRWCARNPEAVRPEGFSFHLTGYSAVERARAAHALVAECMTARSAGLAHGASVNLGGGLPVRYVAPDDWADFLEQNRPEHYHAHRELDTFYPYGSEHQADDVLRVILEHPDQHGESLRAKAARLGIRLLLEPGRALVDHAGFTVFRVRQVDDRREDGHAVVTVCGSSFSLSEQWFASEYLPEPVLLQPGTATGEFATAVAGSTCLEDDMLTWRTIRFPRPVVPGDHLVYLNTAGYQMDSNESPFHDVALPRKVVLRLDEQPGAARWHLDDVDLVTDTAEDVPA